jgi:hypothetical protein
MLQKRRIIKSRNGLKERNEKKGRSRRIRIESKLRREERKREGRFKDSKVRGKTEGEIGKVSARERGYTNNTTQHSR